MKVQDKERVGDVGAGSPPMRHLYEGTRLAPPTIGSTALCGHRATAGDLARPGGKVWSREIRGEHCVVCVETARAQGWI